MVDLAAIRDAATVGLLGLGTFLFLSGAIGALRFPDLYNRIHAVTKTTTIAILTILLSGLLTVGFSPIGLKIVATMIFLSLTVPLSGQLLARAGYRSGVPLAPQTIRDDYQHLIEFEEMPGEARVVDVPPK